MPRTLLAGSVAFALAALSHAATSDDAPTRAAPSAPVAAAAPKEEAPDAGAPPASADVKVDDAAFDFDSALPAHADPVVDYELRATLDPAAHRVHGEGSIKWRNTSAVPVRELWVHLYLNAFKNQRSTFLREPLGGFRGDSPVRDWGYIDVQRFVLRDATGATDLWPKVELRRPNDEDETDARVPLPREVAPNETITIDLSWDDKLPWVVERTGYADSFHLVGQWFPKIARLEPDGRWAHFPFHHAAEFYADFGTYDVTLDVPQAFLVGATGPMVDSRIEAGRRIERHVQADVHDFAWTAWDQWQTTEETIDGVRVTLLYPPNFRVVAQRELRAMRFALPHYSARYGRYPYDVLTVVHPPERAHEAGGMEYPTFITSGGPWYGPPGIFTIEDVTIHEFGHQYFYGLLASNEVEWPFLDEGLNSYSEQLALGEWRGPGSIAEVAGLSVSDTTAYTVYSNIGNHLSERVAQPAYAFATGLDYGALVYGRTATILETFRRVYGDEAMTRVMGRYARKNRFRHPVPDDLIAMFAEVLGQKAAQTLRTALFDKGWVNYRVVDISASTALEASGVFDRDGKRETLGSRGAPGGGYEGWALVMREGTLSFPVDIELTRTDGKTERVRWDGESETLRVPFRANVGLRAAVIDPDRNVLLEERLVDNHRTVRGEATAGAPRTMERVMYWAELLLQTVLP